MTAVLFVPPHSNDSEWKKSDDLLPDIKRELEKYCLCDLDWTDKTSGTIGCSGGTGCEGASCYLWVSSYDIGLHEKLPDGTSRPVPNTPKTIRVGTPEPPKEGALPGAVFLPEDKPQTTMKLGEGGDVVKTTTNTNRVFFCSCGTQADIAKLKAQHDWVKPPVGDPPK